MYLYNKIAGSRGEKLAVDYLIEKEFVILDKNVYMRWGEIDIVAKKGMKIHFIEVKSRISIKQGLPYEAVRIPKLFHLLRSIQAYIKMHNLYKFRFQVDVIAIFFSKNRYVQSLKYYENVEVDRFL